MSSILSIYNIYIPISIFFCVIGLVIVTVIIAKNKLNFHISKDGINIMTKSGHYISVEIARECQENMILFVTRREYIKNSEILNSQMSYVERRMKIMLREMIESIRKNLNLEYSDKQYQEYEMVVLKVLYFAQLEEIRIILKINHIASKKGDTWTNYKKTNRDLLWTVAISIMSEMFDKREYNRDHVKGATHEDIARIYDSYVYEIFDKVQEIAIEYRNEIIELNEKIQGAKKCKLEK